MLNHFDDTIKLRKITPTITDGFATQTVTTREVWADRQSATRQEYYAAAAVNRRIDVIFVVNTIDFADEEELEYKLAEAHDKGLREGLAFACFMALLTILITAIFA